MRPTLETAYNLLMTETTKTALEFILARQDDIFQTELHLQFFQAILSYYQGNTESAFAQFSEMFDQLCQNPDHMFEWWEGVELLDVLHIYGQLDQADRYITAQLTYNQDNPTLLNERGLLDYQRGNYPAAIQSYQDALSLLPDEIQILSNLGMAHVKADQPEHAIPVFERAILLDDPDQPTTQLALKELIKLCVDRRGACNSCHGESLCCKNMKLRLNEGYVNSDETLTYALNLDPRNTNWIRTGIDEDGHWIFNCRHLDEYGKCREHTNRPQACRDFPSIFFDRNKFPACSYRFKGKKVLPLNNSRVQAMIEQKTRQLLD